jgi:hypothetical protein
MYVWKSITSYDIDQGVGQFQRENVMAFQVLFGSDAGLLSVFTIGFILCMAIFLFIFARKQMSKEDSKR